jgi:ribosomal protein L19E
MWNSIVRVELVKQQERLRMILQELFKKMMIDRSEWSETYNFTLGELYGVQTALRLLNESNI